MLIRALPVDPASGSTAPHWSSSAAARICDTLRGLAEQSGVAEHVMFTGGVPSAELPAYHAMADVFAMPCRTRGAGLDVEGLGIVFLEASATGVPVVAGSSGGAPETVQHNKTGHGGRRQFGRRRSPTPSASCWPTRTAPPRWAPPAGEWVDRAVAMATTWPADCPT